MHHDREMLDRIRRVETRVTKIGDHLGVETGGGRPAWDDTEGRVVIPTPNCSIKAMIDVVPEDRRHTEIDVFVKDDYLLSFFVDQ